MTERATRDLASMPAAAPRRSVGVFGMSLVVAGTVLVMAAIDVLPLSSMPFAWPPPWRMVLAGWGPFLLASPLIAWVGVHFRARLRPWWAVAIAQVLTCATVLELHALAVRWLVLPSGEMSPEAMMALLPEELQSKLPIEQPFTTVEVSAEPPGVLALLSLVPSYALLAMLVQALLAFGELQRRRLAEQELRGELSRAQLAALRMRLQPHFLFNTLNSVNALIAKAPERAREMLGDLSTLLRRSFQDSERQQVALADELELLERYVNIQRVRFGDRLQLQLDVDEALRDVMVPSLSLQPLLENSIVHAVERTTQPVRVSLRVAMAGEQLQVVVEDDGPGEGPELPAGIGLDNVRQRLVRLHGAQASLVAERLPRGFRTTLVLPARRPTDGGRQA